MYPRKDEIGPPIKKCLTLYIPSIIVDLEVNSSFIEANIVYSKPIPRFEKHTRSFLIVMFSTNTGPNYYFEMHLHKIIGRYSRYSNIVQVPIS